MEYFSSYEHMENYDHVRDIKWMNDSSIQFICTEKIHGTNYSFLKVDGKPVVPCKRTSILKEDDCFMKHQRVFNKYKEQVEVLYNNIKTLYPNMVSMQLFGELFGGCYDGVTAPGAKVVQKNMNYHPDNEFMAYDIRLAFQFSSSHYCDFSCLVSWCKAVGIPTVPVFMEGTLQECLEYSSITESRVPALFGLPPMKDGATSAAEGCVIKPNQEKWKMQNGKRFIFKKKNPAFREVEPISDDSSINVFSTDTLRRYVTQQRYDNVYSKLSEAELSNIDQMLYDDIVVDLLEDYPNLTENEHKMVRNFLPKCIQSFKKKMALQ